MGKFLIGIAVGVVVTILGIVVIGFAMARLFESKKPTIAANSALILSLEGAMPEASGVEIPLPVFESQATPSVRDIWASLHAAATDGRIKAVVLKPRGLAAGWGKLEELRQEIIQFKKSGKPVYAVLQGAGSREYYLASAADRIFVSPDDLLNVKGFRIETMYLKNALDKVGVEMQVDHIGRYKDAGDMFTRTGMSPETREVLGEILDQIYNDFCATTGQGRHKSADEMRAVIDAGPFLATAAKSSGLIDVVGYEDQLFSDLKKRVGSGDINKLDVRTYSRGLVEKGDRIAYLVAQGDIVRGGSDNDYGSSQLLTSASMEKLIRQVRNDSTVKGVVFRVDSPGGDAIASDEILHEMKLLSAAKPVVISFSDVAASGGYFISLTGDPILSYPNTLTGSIGVLYTRPNIHGLLDKLGVQQDQIARGRLADLDSLAYPLSDAAKQKLHELIDSTYHSFVGKVAQARRKTYDQIDPLAQGRVWMGQQARLNGLVDQLGGLDEAVALVRQKAKLPPKGDTMLVVYPPKRSLLEILTSSSSEAAADAMIDHKIRSLLPALPSASMLKGGLQRVMPYRISVQ